MGMGKVSKWGGNQQHGSVVTRQSSISEGDVNVGCNAYGP
jgi:hypothetical protein